MRWRAVLLLEWSWSYDVVHFDGDLKVQRQDGAVDERLGLPQSFCEVLLLMGLNAEALFAQETIQIILCSLELFTSFSHCKTTLKYQVKIQV